MWWAVAALAAVPGDLAGQWAFVGGDPELAVRDAMVEDTAQTFNFATRGFARPKLQKLAALDERITIEGSEEALHVVFRGENDRESRAPADGTPVELRGASIRFEVEPDKQLTITGETQHGGKQSVYALTGPDTLQVTHNVWSGMLSKPMVWTLTYRKQ